MRSIFLFSYSIMGALDYLLTNFCTVTTTRSRRTKHKPMQTVEIKVKMDCDGCERRVRHAVTAIKGVKTVEVNRKQSHVKITGNIEPNKVLNRVKNTGKRAEFWPYIAHNLVYQPHASGTYDKRAPAGYVRNSLQAFPATDLPEEKMTSLFSDDNVNACSIM